jgi:F-type H+-transporting ATPase subunit gamma
MASTQQLKGRITSVKNTRQITKAMELVSASKMRRAQEYAVRSRAYRNLARQILTRLSEVIDISQHPLYVQRTVTRRLHVVITSDRGLAGAYNSNVLRRFTAELQADKEAGIQSSIILIGRKGASFVSRLQDIDVIAVYEQFPEQPTANDLRPILETLIEWYRDEKTDAVDILYTDYISSVTQEVKVDRLLPAVFKKTRTSDELEPAIIEPDPKTILEEVTERLVEAQLTQDFVEAQASEQSMRMMAMKNATDNANDLVNDLTLAFNTARQAAITQELAEITSGAEAIK